MFDLVYLCPVSVSSVRPFYLAGLFTPVKTYSYRSLCVAVNGFNQTRPTPRASSSKCHYHLATRKLHSACSGPDRVLVNFLIFPVSQGTRVQLRLPSRRGRKHSGKASGFESKKRKTRFADHSAPIPIHSPAFGPGMILGLGYIFKLKRRMKFLRRPWSGSSGPSPTTAHTAAGCGGHLYFDENKYQTRFAVAKGRVNYDFFGIGRLPSAAGDPGSDQAERGPYSLANSCETLARTSLSGRDISTAR